MSSKPISPVLKAWYNWKALRLPWRKRFLVGLDLHGNTYWEFRDVRGDDAPGRWRRIVKYPSNVHYGDVKVSPQWHQWLRHIRDAPPSLQEQRQDVVRQEQMKKLAAQADARWEAKPSYIDASGEVRGQPLPALETEPPASFTSRNPRANSDEVQPQGKEQATRPSPIESQEPAQTDGQQVRDKDDPWKRNKGPSEGWQPKAWTPSSPSKR